ncbi:MAG TPA: MFS transporter [bacterium]|nr:MFS transporter [bacterium]
MLCGALVFMLSAGTRQSFGLFLRPMSSELGWGREVFGFSVALATLVIGGVAPFMGAVADRFGSGRVILLGGMLWALGLFGMAHSSTPLAMTLFTGLVVGMGAAATSVSIAIGAVGRQVPDAMRSKALGVVTSGGSVGQMLVLPLAQGLIAWLDWRLAMTLLGGIMVLLIPAALGLGARPVSGSGHGDSQRITQALAEAGGHRGFLLLTAGFFVCGFHVSFIATHLPSYVVDSGLLPSVGAAALFLIGLFNVAGSYAWGRWGGLHSKKYLLSTIYLARAAVITVFLLVPVSTLSVLLFAGAMGFLWLGTVPLTSGLVGQIFGVRYLSTLFGIVFFSHQVGGFLGAWLGGYLYDVTHSYTLVWLIAIALGVFSALVHLPIDDKPVQRIAMAKPSVAAEY